MIEIKLVATRHAEHDALWGDMRRGGIIAGVFFAGVLGRAAFTPLDAGAHATGVVAVSGNRQAVQHRDGGIVTDLAVTEGQKVAKGNRLLTILASNLVAAERGLIAEVLALMAQRQRQRLIAVRSDAAQIAAPLEFASLSKEDRALGERLLRDQRLLFEARRSSISTQRNVLRQRAHQHS